MAETVIRVSSGNADLRTLRIYVKWLKIPDLPKNVVTDRSSYE